MDIRRAAEWNLLMAIISKPKPVKQAKKSKRTKPRRKILEQQLEAVVKLIVFWRDGAECVERHIDGARCGGGIQWGHYIPRQQSRWLKYNLATFAQCRNHNNLHDKGAQTMGVWFCDTFGTEAAKALELERAAHRGQPQQTIQELEEMLAHYDELYQNRYFVELTLERLVAAGYYGEVIKSAWIMDGRI